MSAKSQSVIENTFSDVIKKYNKGESIRSTSDLYVQTYPDSGEVQIYDDEEQLLGKVVIFDWVNYSEGDEQFRSVMTETLRNALASLSSGEAFESTCFIKPFSISLTDEEFNVLEELLFVDDENYRLDDPLLKDLDTDLDEFLANLLSDFK